MSFPDFLWFYHAGWKSTWPVWSPDRPPRPLCGAQVLRQPPSGGLLQNARQVAKAKVTRRLQGGRWIEIDAFKRAASWWRCFSMFCLPKIWYPWLIQSLNFGSVWPKWGWPRLKEIYEFQNGLQMVILKWELVGWKCVAFLVSLFFVICSSIPCSSLLAIIVVHGGYSRKVTIQERVSIFSKTSLALLADESTFTFPRKIWGQAKATVAMAVETVLCFAHLLKGTCLCRSRWPLLNSSMMLHVFPKQISQLQILFVACSVFHWIWRLCFGANPKDSPRVQSDSRAKDQKEAMCSVKLWDIFLRLNYLELTSADGVKDSEFQSGRGMVSTYAGSTLDASTLAIRFCQSCFWKCPNIGERIVVPIKQRTFFCLIHEFFPSIWRDMSLERWIIW